MTAALADELAGLLGPEAVRAGAAVALLDPGWNPHNLDAGLVVSPATTAEVSRLLAFCHERGIGVVPQGGRTGLVGGAVSLPGEVVLSLTRMAAVAAIDPVGRTAVVEAGVTLERLQQAAAEHGLDPAIDTAARGSATIGGMIATCAGGIRAFRHGVMRHRVLGLEAVLADGTVIDDMTQVLKTSSGYDLKQLLVGSEGTLGVVTRAVIRLEPLPGPRATALIGLPGAAAALAVVRHFLGADGPSLQAAEIMSGGYATGSAAALGVDGGALGLGAPVHLIVEVSGSIEAETREALEDGLATVWESAGIQGGVVAATLKQRETIWLIREASDAIGRAYGLELWYDVSVPPARIDAYVAEAGRCLAAVDPALELHFIGHLADGNLHVMAARRERPEHVPHEAIEAALYEGLREAGGAFSAEHGVGLDKREALARHGDPGKLAAMRAVKAALDPRGILNPGKVLPPA
ncbi:FAD-binding oxidoreductase [Labrys wisconsinensis]|uniref:FAD/FMN-containing dehydrogenase n=1 Tax=Labrys wisconsinensis TaxID=425677 RepID=A0ABU0J0R2_9HYPH|nr:FAD-binding oxidoreductase [Labrys wisconsinensis]MDQ0467838.1 FAD/FMN-containing dehydrogenase [Labrys wisconsinensis]